MEELKQVLEAILFSAARRVELSELAKLSRKTEQEVLDTLNAWKTELETNPGPLTLIQDGTAWKLTIRERYLPIVKKVVTKTELPKSLLQTLAVVAYKAPVLQSAVIKIRTNKAYDHLNQLEDSVLITREKKGRTKLIKLTPKFYEYFDIDPTQLKKKFHNMGDVEKAIENKEKEIEQAEKEQQERTRKNLEEPEIKIHGEVVTLPNHLEMFMEKLGELEVYDVPKHEKHKQIDKIEENIPKQENTREETGIEKAKSNTPEEEIVSEASQTKFDYASSIDSEVQEKTRKLKKKTFEGKGLYPKGMPPEMEQKVDERVKEIVEGEHKEQ